MIEYYYIINAQYFSIDAPHLPRLKYRISQNMSFHRKNIFRKNNLNSDGKWWMNLAKTAKTIHNITPIERFRLNLLLLCSQRSDTTKIWIFAIFGEKWNHVFVHATFIWPLMFSITTVFLRHFLTLKIKSFWSNTGWKWSIMYFTIDHHKIFTFSN